MHLYYWGYDDVILWLVRSLDYLKVLELVEERRNLLQLHFANLLSVKYPSILVAFNLVPVRVLWWICSFCVCYIWSKFQLQLTFVKKQDDSLDSAFVFYQSLDVFGEKVEWKCASYFWIEVFESREILVIWTLISFSFILNHPANVYCCLIFQWSTHWFWGWSKYFAFICSILGSFIFIYRNLFSVFQ